MESISFVNILLIEVKLDATIGFPEARCSKILIGDENFDASTYHLIVKLSS